jgi:Fungal protein kinase
LSYCQLRDRLRDRTFLGHRRLWENGVEHGDINVQSLMYDKSNNSGVLNDFDLSHRAQNKMYLGNERTGTMQFMALDVLTEEARDGLIPRLYRDAESFAWVLLWICLPLQGRSRNSQRAFAGLDWGWPQVMLECKNGPDACSSEISPMEFYERYRFAVALLVRWAQRTATSRWSFDQLRGQAGPPPEELTIKQVVQKYCDILKDE